MALDFANTASTSLMPAATVDPNVLVATTVTAMPTATASPASAVAGDADNTQHVTTSSTIMIVVGCILGILGVAGVITLIWWMRRRALAQQTYRINDIPQAYAPQPPPKGGHSLLTQKSLPQINPGASRTARSGTVGSADKDKALPVKPAESVWAPTPPGPRSPALASVHEMTTTTTAAASRGRSPAEMKYERERSTSVGSYKNPQNFI